MKKSIGAQPLVYPTPVFVVGSYDKAGKANAMTVSWGGICCSEPPCVAIALREATYTYHAIMARRAFTVNIPSEDQMKIADYLGMVSGRSENKLEKMKLTSIKADKVDAPFIKEFPLVLECSVKEVVKIGLHTQFIGEIKDIKVEEGFLTKEGLPDIEKIKPFIFAPAVRKYYGLSAALGKAFAVGKKE